MKTGYPGSGQQSGAATRLRLRHAPVSALTAQFAGPAQRVRLLLPGQIENPGRVLPFTSRSPILPHVIRIGKRERDASDMTLFRGFQVRDVLEPEHQLLTIR